MKLNYKRIPNRLRFILTNTENEPVTNCDRFKVKNINEIEL